MNFGEETDNDSSNSSDMGELQEATKLIASLDTRRDKRVIIKKPISFKGAASRIMSQKIKSYLRFV